MAFRGPLDPPFLRSQRDARTQGWTEEAPQKATRLQLQWSLYYRPKQCTGRALQITIGLHCLIPPNIGIYIYNLMTPIIRQLGVWVTNPEWTFTKHLPISVSERTLRGHPTMRDFRIKPLFPSASDDTPTDSGITSNLFFFLVCRSKYTGLRALKSISF